MRVKDNLGPLFAIANVWAYSGNFCSMNGIPLSWKSPYIYAMSLGTPETIPERYAQIFAIFSALSQNPSSVESFTAIAFFRASPVTIPITLFSPSVITDCWTVSIFVRNPKKGELAVLSIPAVKAISFEIACAIFLKSGSSFLFSRLISSITAGRGGILIVVRSFSAASSVIIVAILTHSWVLIGSCKKMMLHRLRFPRLCRTTDFGGHFDWFSWFFNDVSRPVTSAKSSRNYICDTLDKEVFGEQLE